MSTLPPARVVGVIMPEDLPHALGLAAPVPVVDLDNWSDERQCCKRVHAYLAGDIDGKPTEYMSCTSYRGGRCGGNGHRAPCLFHEAESTPGWQRARQWVPVTCADGTTALQRRQIVPMEVPA